MKDFKNSTRTQYMKGGSCEGYAKGGSVKGAAKISKVMGEFKRGELHSGSKKGPEVTSQKQATAIALSEARKAGAKIPQQGQTAMKKGVPVKKAIGGAMPARAAARAATTVGGAKAPVRKVAAPVRGPGGAGFAAKPTVGKSDLMNAMANKPDMPRPMADRSVGPQPMVGKPDVQQPMVGKPVTMVGRPVTMKHGGKVVKKGNGGGIDRSMLESTSARPVKVGPTPEEKAAGAAVARGNRMQALEAREEAKLMREKRPSHQTEGERRRLMTEGELARRSKAVPVASREPKVRNALMDRLTQLPSQRGEFPIRKAGGGLAAMPKGKKC